MTTPAPSPAPFSWTSPHFGQPGHNVHVAAWAPDRHDESEARQS